MKQKTKANILTVSPVNPVVGALVYNKLDNKLMVFNGVTWRQVGEIIRYCVICNGAEWHHEMHLSHPFCSNNLEFLEYKYDQSKLKA
jgi:hypothetical protein